MEFSIKEIVSDDSLTAEEALRKMGGIIVDYCEQNVKMFSVLLDYLLQLKKTGADTNEKVTRRVLRLRHLTSTLIIRGIQNGEFKNLNVHKINELIYSLVESSLFRIAVLNQTDMTEIRDALNLVIDGFLNK